MSNGVEIRDKIASSSNRLSGYLKELQANRQDDSQGQDIDRTAERKTIMQRIIEDMFLRALCRKPSDNELRGSLQTLESAEDPRVALEDILWALLNSKEFMMLR
jgi:hypothetical protein